MRGWIAYYVGDQCARLSRPGIARADVQQSRAVTSDVVIARRGEAWAKPDEVCESELELRRAEFQARLPQGADRPGNQGPRQEAPKGARNFLGMGNPTDKTVTDSEG